MAHIDEKAILAGDVAANRALDDRIAATAGSVSFTPATGHCVGLDAHGAIVCYDLGEAPVRDGQAKQ